MAIGFHTGVLQDKTLDIARVHDQVMTDLLTHGLQKQEQREQEFVQMMSTDFINGLNNKAQEVQLKALREFNELGTSIYKQRGKFGQIKLDDQIKIKKEKDRLQALQDNMRTTLQTFDKARMTIAQDMGRKYDMEDSKKSIYQAFDEWDGESIITIDKLLVPAYGNIGESLRDFIKGYGFGEEEITEITTTQGGQQYLEKVGVRYGGGFKTNEERIQAMRSWAGEPTNQRDALKLFNSEDITESTKQNMMKVTEDLMRDNPDFNQTEALTIAVGMIQDGRGIEGMWTQKRVLDRKKPESTSTRAPGGKEKLLPYQEKLTKPLKREGQVQTMGGRPLRGKINISGFKLDGLPDEFKQGNYTINLTQAFDDGDIFGTYTSSRGEDVIPMITSYIKVNPNAEDKGEGVARLVYEQLLGTSNFTIKEKDGEFVPYGKADEAYTVRLDGTDDEVLDLIDNSVYGFKEAFKEQMRLAAQKKQEGVGENKNKPRKKPTGIKWK